MNTVDPTVSVETPLAWAAGTVVFRVSGVAGADTLPVLVIGRDTVAVRYAAPDSLVGTAPDTQGIFTVWLGLRGRGLLPVGTIQLAGGFSGVWNFGPIGGHVVAWPGIPRSSFAVSFVTGMGLVDPRLRTANRVLPDSVFSSSCNTGVGPATGGRVVVASQSSGCRLLAVLPDSPFVAADTGPRFGGGRFAAQLAPGRWLGAYHHGVSSWLRDPSGTWVSATTPYHVEEPYDIAVSPRGDRAVVLGRDAAGIGIPVFAPGSAEPAYLLTHFTALWGAVFSDDGDTLFVVGPTGNDTTAILAALAASDGTVLKSAPAWSGVSNLVLDPAKPLVYLVGHTWYWGSPAVQVVDRASFAPVALLVGPHEPEGAGDAYSILSLAERRLYIVDSCSFCDVFQAPIFTVDLMP